MPQNSIYVDTKVKMKCPRDKAYKIRAVTDSKGFYVLKGKGVPKGCTLKIEHPQIAPIEVKINYSHIVDDTYPASPVYEVNAELK